MKNRILIAVIVVLVLLGIVFLPKLFKKSPSPVTAMAESQEEVLKPANADSYISEAETYVERGSLLEAKEIFLKLMTMPLSSQQLGSVQGKLESLNIKILLSGINIPQSQIYEVVPGDVLVNIAKKYNTTVEAIVMSNNIKNNVIYPGMKLRVIDGKFSIFVDKSQNILILKLNGEVVKTYSVSTGDNNSTPIGTYKITTKLVDPVWYKEGTAIPASSPENILGSRWMGFDLPKYGIHGTTEPDKIGMQITAGCVRMLNKDVEEIFSLVPIGTEVTIVD
jgi:lipoprotein-anchoring transpeptidase ErfK/SrfK